VFENELQDKISKIRLTDEVEPNFAHVTMLYFWDLEAKLNIAWSSDINARTIIEVV